MKRDVFDFWDLVRQFQQAPPERQLAVVEAFHAALCEPAELSESSDKYPLHTLSEIAKKIRKHPSRLHRLNIQKVGERLAGRFFYRENRVLEYLASPACRARVAELSAAERARRASRAKESATVGGQAA